MIMFINEAIRSLSTLGIEHDVAELGRGRGDFELDRVVCGAAKDVLSFLEPTKT